jgi:uncharacterized membrane protein
MEKVNKLILSAISGALAMMSVANSPVALAKDAAMEKCYGIVKKGMNDCQTATASCASSATKDNQPDAFLLLPVGLCNKIVGGKLTSPATEKNK